MSLTCDVASMNQPTKDLVDPTLLAVDLGLRTGLALYGGDGRLRWYRSHNFGNNARLKRGAHTILNELPQLQQLVIEGSGPYAAIWHKEAARRNIALLQLSAEEWRPLLLHEHQQRSGRVAKAHADQLARAVIAWSGAATPTALRHDAAEAILVGLWAVLTLGWLAESPL